MLITKSEQISSPEVSHAKASFLVSPSSCSECGSHGFEEVRVVYGSEKALSTEASLLPWHMTRLLPGHVGVFCLKVTQSASGVSHDLQHVAFLSTRIMKPLSFSDSPTHSHNCRAACQSKPHRPERVLMAAVWCERIRPAWDWCQQLSHKVNGHASQCRGLQCNALVLQPRVTDHHHH